MDVITTIKEKLLEIEEQENVTILHAVESGSRAWGFASPDSDYDVRFIYVRRKNDYLKLNEPRDVIEWQLDELLDINGWDLKKTLIQFRKGNATLFEWSNSPIVYHTTDLWRQINEVGQAFFSVKAAAYHYYAAAKGTYLQYLQEDKGSYKKYFYALRPLLAGQYIQENQCPPPVLFDSLMRLNMQAGLRDSIMELLEVKKISDEKENSRQFPVIKDFIASEIKKQQHYAETVPDDHKKDWEELNQIFLKTLGFNI